jgi:hypothetical protein
MNTKYIYIIGGIALFSFMFPRCASSTQENTNIILVNLPSDSNNELISDHLLLSDIICLETIDSSLIKSIRRLIIHRDTIIILNDREEVLFFDMNGKFLNKIHNRGGGPGEYNHIIDIAINYDREDIILYTDNFSLLIYSLDGAFISKTNNIDTSYLYEKIICDNNILFFYNPMNTEKERIIRSFDLNNSKYTDNKFIGKTADFILRQRGVPIVKSKSIWYVVPLENSLLNLKDTVVYQVNCDNFGITKAILDKQYTDPGKLVKEINEKQICYGFSSIRETNRFIYFKSNIHNFIRLDKTNNEVEWCQYVRDPNNNISDMSYFPHDAEDLQIMFIANLNSLKNPDILKRYTQKMNDSQDEEPNPVLIFYKEKTVNN